MSAEDAALEPPVTDRVYERSLSEEALTGVLALVGKAEELLRSPRLPDVTEVRDLPTASAALESIWRGVRAATTGETGRLAEADDLLPLLLALKETDDEVQEERALKQSCVMRRVQNALGRFQQTSSVSELIDATPEVVCTLGFDRAIVSRIHESTWMTEALHVEGDTDWAEEILRAGRDNPQRLVPGLFETEIVRRGRAMTVTNVQQESRVHRAVADASLSRSYVAAPIMPRAQVIGFLHADRYFQRDELTAFDRDVLAIFSEGFGYALERAILVERLAELRAKVRHYTEGLASVMDTSVSEPLAVDRRRFTANGPAPRRSPENPWTGEFGLTRREADVLRLMAGGDTNARIADKLIISEGTVKSHVKHILRKLDAANRAEAVSVWLHGQQAT